MTVPTAPVTTVTSSYQHLKRKLHSGKSETYDLTKVTDITHKTYTYTRIKSLFETPEANQ
jgi:hypothetical protein